MRVALVGPYPLDTSRFGGGVETAFFNLLGGLASFPDVEPHVITFTAGVEKPRHDLSGPAPVLYLPSRARLKNLTFYRDDRRMLGEALADLRPDLVHAQDAVGYGYVTLRTVRDVPVVVSVHGIVREELKHLSGRLDRIRTATARVALERYCIRNARYLVEPSRYPERYFGSRIRGTIVDIGNGISDSLFDAQYEPETGRLLYVGAVTSRKRVLDLLEVFDSVRKEVQHVALRIAGPADVEYGSVVAARVEELGLTGLVKFLGPLSPDELLEEYRRASIFLLVSGEENSPMVIREAMAVGVPVIATRTGAVDDLVEDGRTGFLTHVGEISVLAERTIELLENDERRTAFGGAARAAAGTRFRSADVAARLRDVYAKALRETGARV